MHETDAFYTRKGFNRSRKMRNYISPVPFLPQGETQVFWFCPPGYREPVDVHVIKEVALSALPAYIQQDYTVAIAPFVSEGDTYVVIQDVTGRRICLVERGKAAPVLS